MNVFLIISALHTHVIHPSYFNLEYDISSSEFNTPSCTKWSN